VFPEVAARLGMRWVDGPAGRIATRLRDYSLKAAAANVVVGERMAEYVRGIGNGAANVEVIENWSDSALVGPVPRESNPLRAQWKLEDRFVIGYSGNMGRAHEFDTILDACMLLRDDARFAFLFVGGGRQLESVREEAKRRSLSGVAFQPYQPRESLGQSLSAADVHLVTLQPALEGLIVPSKFYGIAAAGRPTIFIGDLDGEIARLLRRHACGISVRTGDSQGLADAIRDLASPSGEAMGRAAREAYLREHDRAHAVRRWAALLERLAPQVASEPLK
jgi:glycosyltransferase involved in cell wall biosynthesis